MHIRKGAYIMRRENVVVERHKIVDQIVLFGAGLKGEGEEESMKASRARRRLECTKKLRVYERMEFQLSK